MFTHTCHCCDALAELPNGGRRMSPRGAILMFAVLAHDFANHRQTHTAERRPDADRVAGSRGTRQAAGGSVLARIGSPE